MTHSITPTHSSFIPPSYPTGFKNISLNKLYTAVNASSILGALEKKFYSQIIQCVHNFGNGNDLELFHAAGYCFDVVFGPNLVHNIITIEDYLSVMGEETQGTLGENDYISAEFFAHDRPGFFLLTPEGSVYFLKEDVEGSLVYYDAHKDAFVKSASLPVTGKEKLVVLNKSTHPSLETFYNVFTPDQPVEGKFYHEKQDDRKCGIHALHAFLGFPVVNETHLSLMKLEMLTLNTYVSDLPLHYRQPGQRKVDPTHLPAGQLAYYKNTARFKLAQTSLYQADLGNNVEALLLLLKQMTTLGTLDQKYQHARIYKIDITGLEVKYAQEKGLYSEGQDWDVNLAKTVLDAVTADLNKDKAVIEDLDQKIQEMRRQDINLDQWNPKYPEYRQLIMDRNPYDILEMRAERLETTIQGMKELQTEFERGDRLLVLSSSEDHCFTLRKDENREWVVIDSENSEQIRVSDPLNWLKNRQKAFFEANGTCNYEFITLAKT